MWGYASSSCAGAPLPLLSSAPVLLEKHHACAAAAAATSQPLCPGERQLRVPKPQQPPLLQSSTAWAACQGPPAPLACASPPPPAACASTGAAAVAPTAATPAAPAPVVAAGCLFHCIFHCRCHGSACTAAAIHPKCICRPRCRRTLLYSLRRCCAEVMALSTLSRLTRDLILDAVPYSSPSILFTRAICGARMRVNQGVHVVRRQHAAPARRLQCPQPQLQPLRPHLVLRRHDEADHAGAVASGHLQRLDELQSGACAGRAVSKRGRRHSARCVRPSS